MPQRTDNIIIPQGTTWAIEWPLRTPDGLGVDLDTWTVRSQIRPAAGDDRVLHEWSTAAGTASCTGGVLRLSLAPDVSAKWDWVRNAARYDVEVTAPDGTVLRLAQGSVTVSAEVTK